ncbi:AraC-type DNA-binding protein [Chitinophaga sp. YR573]|uniref:helix-turn-helix transcriptional regulator n=1 Tax=Chitinophaga sp. YR573 TaxID=1881040 RepID=UPI0008B9E6FC|nr:AraC family transcriptional regulator [Chitinophaga sp. YR573]SEW01233.1 AraC-type DNA-binding protein [Chitinophaga sp. YR573]
MLFEFVANYDFNFLSSFAEKFNIPFDGEKLIIPGSLGEGSIRKIDLGPEFKLLLHQYTFKEEFVLKCIAPADNHDIITILFHCNEDLAKLSIDGHAQIQFSKNTDAAVQITSSILDSETRFPANKEINFTVVGIRASLLSSLLSTGKPNNVIQMVTSGSPEFLFYESLSQDMGKLLHQLADTKEEINLSTFYYKIRVQELLYLLFEKLLKRQQQPVHKADIEKLFVVRAAVLSDLSNPPRLEDLARMAGMSETKMRDLFKQVFGNSIYNYFQKARMEEAAFKLKQAGYSVSEVGYQLGFSNLSHFSRLFEKHIGVKPKKYASGK